MLLAATIKQDLEDKRQTENNGDKSTLKKVFQWSLGETKFGCNLGISEFQEKLRGRNRKTKLYVEVTEEFA